MGKRNVRPFLFSFFLHFVLLLDFEMSLKRRWAPVKREREERNQRKCLSFSFLLLGIFFLSLSLMSFFFSFFFFVLVGVVDPSSTWTHTPGLLLFYSPRSFMLAPTHTHTRTSLSFQRILIEKSLKLFHPLFFSLFWFSFNPSNCIWLSFLSVSLLCGLLSRRIVRNGLFSHWLFYFFSPLFISSASVWLLAWWRGRDFLSDSSGFVLFFCFFL